MSTKAKTTKPSKKKNQEMQNHPVQTMQAVPAVETAPKPEASLLRIPLDQIEPSPYNPRQSYPEHEMQELAQSIQTIGLLQPIKVRPMQTHNEAGEEIHKPYQITFGERRFRAHQTLGYTEIVCIVETMTDAEAEDATITENLQRVDVSPVQEAYAFHRLVETGRYDVAGLAQRFGKSDTYIRQRLALLELHEGYLQLLNNDTIPLGIALELTRYPKETQQEVFEEHFANDVPYGDSWAKFTVREFARIMQKKYSLRLSDFKFDKTPCESCFFNSQGSRLFRDTVQPAYCGNKDCLDQKQREFLVGKAARMSDADSNLVLAAQNHADMEVVEALMEKGYTVEAAPYSWEEVEELEMPERENYQTEEEYNTDFSQYMEDKVKQEEQYQDFEKRVAEGELIKCAVIELDDVYIRFVEVEEVEESEEEDAQDDENDEAAAESAEQTEPEQPGEPEAPAVYDPVAEIRKLVQERNDKIEKLKDLDREYRQGAEDSIRRKSWNLLKTGTTSTRDLTEEEQAVFYLALLQYLKACHNEIFGVESIAAMTMEDRMRIINNLTDGQRQLLCREFLLDHVSRHKHTSDPLRIKLYTQLAKSMFPEQFTEIEQDEMKEYKKKHKEIETDISELEQQNALLTKVTDPQPVAETSGPVNEEVA